MNIAIDLDNTLFDNTALIKSVLSEFGIDWNDFEPKYYDVYAVYPKDVADRIVYLFGQKEQFLTPLLDEKIPKVIENLEKKHCVKIITARFSNNPNIIIDNQEFPFAYYYTVKQLRDNKIYIPYENIIISGQSKIDLFKQHKINLVFDDNPEVVTDCLKNNIDCVMISNDDTLYNHHLRNHVVWANTFIEALQIKDIFR